MPSIQKYIFFILTGTLLINSPCYAEPGDGKIAVLAYGSLVNTLSRGSDRTLSVNHNVNNGTGDQNSWIQSSKLKFPIWLGGLAGKDTNEERHTAVIDKRDIQNKRWVFMYFATSTFDKLKNARENLSMREGSAGNLGITQKFCIKEYDSNNHDSGKCNASKSLCQMVATWLKNSSYTAAIWADYPAKSKSQKGVAQHVKGNLTVFKNTKIYINEMPQTSWGSLEKAINKSTPTNLQPLEKWINTH